PEAADTYLMLGRACRLFGRYEQGLQALLRAGQLGDREASRQLMRDIILRLGTSDYAVATLRQLLESYPESADLHYQLGSILQRTNATAAALRHLEQA